jgi:hypothetical protein
VLCFAKKKNWIWRQMKTNSFTRILYLGTGTILKHNSLLFPYHEIYA